MFIRGYNKAHLFWKQNLIASYEYMSRRLSTYAW
jgi:hypothetical protein